ncbi:MAG TPA: Maf family protein [Acidisarcina sp.]|nr:Maf family protein [Acidisarcina sp.]
MLVLASASPRRRELLTQAGFEFRVLPSSVPEEHQPGEDAISFATRLAREKAQAVFDEHSALDDAENPLLVLGADTVVVVDGEILGKPASRPDAARMLAQLSGRTHQVITGVCLLSRAGMEAAAEVTFVRMQTLSTAEIEAYVASGEPMDKAGAYAIQGYAARWIPRIQGCYFNVVGLPLSLVANLIEGMHRRLKRSASLMSSAG